VCTLFGLQFYPLLFVTGFIKHLIGYYSGIQTVYCKKNGLRRAKFSIPSCLYESFIFLLYGIILKEIYFSQSTVPYVLAFTIHLIAEISGLHGRFIRDYCKE